MYILYKFSLVDTINQEHTYLCTTEMYFCGFKLKDLMSSVYSFESTRPTLPLITWLGIFWFYFIILREGITAERGRLKEDTKLLIEDSNSEVRSSLIRPRTKRNNLCQDVTLFHISILINENKYAMRWLCSTTNAMVPTSF